MDTIHTLPEKPARKFLNTESLLEYCRDVYDLPISRITIYREQQKGRLHPVRRGGRLLFCIAEVDAWIQGDSVGQLNAEKGEG